MRWRDSDDERRRKRATARRAIMETWQWSDAAATPGRRNETGRRDEAEDEETEMETEGDKAEGSWERGSRCTEKWTKGKGRCEQAELCEWDDKRAGNTDGKGMQNERTDAQ